MRHLLPLIVPLLLFAGCSKESCPPDEFLGTFRMSEKSKALLPYDGVRALVFSSATADTLVFTARQPLTDTLVRNCIYKPCAIALVDETCQYVDRERRSILFDSDPVMLEVRAFWERPNHNEMQLDTSFVESIETQLFDSTAIFTSTRFLSNARGVMLDSAFTHARSVTYIDQVTLIDSTFYEVYTKDNQVWLATGKGLVGFRWAGDLYELKEIIR